MNATVNTHIGRTATVTDEEADSEKHVDMFKVHGRGDVSECPSHSSAIPTERLLPSHPDKASSTSFLSEQDSFVFAAARDRVNLRLRDPSVEIVYGTQANLLKSHKMTVQRPRCIIRETRGGTVRTGGLEGQIEGCCAHEWEGRGDQPKVYGVYIFAGRSTVHAYAHVLCAIITFLRRP